MQTYPTLVSRPAPFPVTDRAGYHWGSLSAFSTQMRRNRPTCAAATHPGLRRAGMPSDVKSPV